MDNFEARLLVIKVELLLGLSVIQLKPRPRAFYTDGLLRTPEHHLFCRRVVSFLHNLKKTYVD